MHIVHVIPFASRVGGYETQGRLLAQAMAARGVDVTIATDAGHARATRRLAPEIPVVGISYRFRRFSRRACEQSVRRATVVHAHALAPLTACVIEEGRRRGVSAVVKVATAGDVREFADPWEHPPQVLDAPAANPQWLANQQRDMSNAWSVLRACERFVALNREIADELTRAGIENHRVLHLPNAVRIPAHPAEVRPHGRHAIYLGRFEDRKRIADLVEALRLVRRELGDRITLELIGRPSRNDLRRWRSEPGLTLSGPTDDPQSALRRADLFVMASEREGCPNALLEAAALGLPCLATSIPGIREWFGPEDDDGRTDASHGSAAASHPQFASASPASTDGSLARSLVAIEQGRQSIMLVPPGEPEQLARAWAHLLTNASLRVRLGAAARVAVARQAGLDQMVDRYLALYADLMDGGGGGGSHGDREGQVGAGDAGGIRVPPAEAPAPPIVTVGAHPARKVCPAAGEGRG